MNISIAILSSDLKSRQDARRRGKANVLSVQALAKSEGVSSLANQLLFFRTSRDDRAFDAKPHSIYLCSDVLRTSFSLGQSMPIMSQAINAASLTKPR